MEHLRIKLSEVRAWIDARDPDTSVDRLRSLSRLDDIEVRRRVASNSHSPPDVLRLLATDVDGSVRANVGLNPASPQDLLSEVASDTSLDVMFSTAELFTLHEDVLRVLVGHTNPFVQAQARRGLAGLRLENMLKTLSVVRADRPSHRLGRILMASGLLRKGELERLLPAVDTWKLPLGQVLVRASILNAETVYQALCCQSKLQQGRRRMQDVVEILETRRSMRRDCTDGNT
ncbi:MAG: hypothetical protein AB7W16_05500 [Candidatus Obscuribacterales bacterium]